MATLSAGSSPAVSKVQSNILFRYDRGSGGTIDLRNDTNKNRVASLRSVPAIPLRKLVPWRGSEAARHLANLSTPIESTTLKVTSWLRKCSNLGHETKLQVNVDHLYALKAHDLKDAPLSPESQQKNELCSYLKLMNMKTKEPVNGHVYQNRRSIRVKNLMILTEKKELERKLSVEATRDSEELEPVLSRKSFEELKITCNDSLNFQTKVNDSLNFNTKFIPEDVLNCQIDFDNSIEIEKLNEEFQKNLWCASTIPDDVLKETDFDSCMAPLAKTWEQYKSNKENKINRKKRVQKSKRIKHLMANRLLRSYNVKMLRNKVIRLKKFKTDIRKWRRKLKTKTIKMKSAPPLLNELESPIMECDSEVSLQEHNYNRNPEISSDISEFMGFGMSEIMNDTDLNVKLNDNFQVVLSGSRKKVVNKIVDKVVDQPLSPPPSPMVSPQLNEVIPVQKTEIKSLHSNLVQKKRTRSNGNTEIVKSQHSINLEDTNGTIRNAYYFDYNLVVTQDLMVSFWTQSALGVVLESQDMWVPKGRIPRLSLDNGSLLREANERVILRGDSFAYVELWTKEHKSDFRERPVADVFAVVYFWKSRLGPDKKFLQLENINGFAEDVRYVVLKNSGSILVSWRIVKDDNTTSVLHLYELGPNYQTIVSIKELESVEHTVSSLHNIEDCDTLVMGCGEHKVTIWNLEYGYIVATIDISDRKPEPDTLWVKCDRGFLFTLQHFPEGIFQLLAIHGLNQNWKRLQMFKTPKGFDKFQGACIEGGLLVCFYENGILCWNIERGGLIMEELNSDVRYLPSGKHIVTCTTEHRLQVRNVLSYLITNYDFQET